MATYTYDIHVLSVMRSEIDKSLRELMEEVNGPLAPAEPKYDPEVMMIHETIDKMSIDDFSDAWGKRFPKNYISDLTENHIFVNTGVSFTVRSMSNNNPTRWIIADPDLRRNPHKDQFPPIGFSASDKRVSMAKFVYFMATVNDCKR